MKRAADAEDHVGVAQEFRHRARYGEAARSQRQRMRFRKRRLAAKAGCDGDGEELGQPFELRPGSCVMHTLPGIDHRALRCDEKGGRFLDVNRIRAVAGAQHRRVIQGLRYFLIPHVGGDFDDHRPAAAVLQLGEGAAEDVADFGGDVDRLGGFRKRLHRLAGIEVGVDIGEPARIAHRQHQHRHGFAIALRHAAHRVLGARSVLHTERADRLARGDARDRVRHVHADAFLAHHHRAYVGSGGKFDDMIDRIAAEDLDSLPLHDFRDGGAELHDGLPVIARPVHSGRFVTVGAGFSGGVKHARRVGMEVLICVLPLGSTAR